MWLIFSNIGAYFVQINPLQSPFYTLLGDALDDIFDDMKKLENKVAVIYGNGTVGGALAKAFAKQGAQVFLTGRTAAKLQAIANEIKSSGGTVTTTQLDALDEVAVNAHMETVLQQAGQVDISFNAIGIPQKGIQGIALAELDVDAFFLPISTYTRSHFITAKAAARVMTERGKGVILMHTPNASRISPPFVGGMVPAWSALEALCRSLSVECGPHGVRAACLQTTGIPETPLIDEVWEIHGKSHGITFEQFHAVMEGMTHRGRLTTLAELTSAAAFVASDEGSAFTGTNVNLTAGMII
jgi:NAD(P)-dependent dehydrogenase (short-subunit alcohol dehydrogenase family)